MMTLKDLLQEEKSIKKQLGLRYIPILYPNIEIALKSISKFSEPPVLFKWKDELCFYSSLSDTEMLQNKNYPQHK